MLLRRWSDGDPAARDHVIPLVYQDLRKLSRYYLRRERAHHTLQTTDLMHQVFLSLQAQHSPQWQTPAEFFNAVGTLIRRVLIDHARGRHTEKRGCGMEKCPLESAFDAPYRTSRAVTALDDALTDLAKSDSRRARIVELRFFVGLSEEEAATVLGISARTVRREWMVARAWLHTYMADQA